MSIDVFGQPVENSSRICAELAPERPRPRFFPEVDPEEGHAHGGPENDAGGRRSVLLDARERGRLVAYAKSRFGICEDDAEDILQDTALDLLRQRKHVASPRIRIRGFSEPLHLNFRKAASPRGSVGARRLRDDGASGELRIVAGQIALREALGGISSSCRRLLAAHYMEGQSLKEAAELLMLTYSNVSKTINRCLRRLRQCLN